MDGSAAAINPVVATGTEFPPSGHFQSVREHAQEGKFHVFCKDLLLLDCRCWHSTND